MISLDDIRAAAARLAGVAYRTPLLQSPALDELTGGKVLLKAENLQRTGSFKIRGAYNMLSQLTGEESARGVVAFSSGNHAQAVAYHACGQIDAAQDALSLALALGELQGYVRTFVDHGAPMADLLRQALGHGIAVDYVGRLLNAMPGETKGERPKTRTEGSSSAVRRPSSPLIEPLNDRELQILRLIAAGLSDRQIAEELYLSVNTVKWYNRQIYAKLGVGRRGQAVARAQELGLL